MKLSGIQTPFVILGAGLALASVLAAQSPTKEAIELSRVEIQAKRQTIVAQAIELTEEEARNFWPLYREWQAASANLDDRVAAMITKLTDEYDTLTEEEAGHLISEWLDVKSREQRLDAKYAKRVQKILPKKKALRFLQLENKLDAIVAYSLTGSVPLAE